jgi:hypothetical protein
MEALTLFCQSIRNNYHHHHHRIYSMSTLTMFSSVMFDIDIDALELELIQTQMAQKPMLRAEVGMRVRCANKASAE